MKPIKIIDDIAHWVWGEDPDVTPDVCLATLPLMNVACWSRLLVKGVGVAIILASCLNKAPIMINIQNSKSAAGLSRFSVYGEAIMYGNAACYGLLFGHPFTAFGENVALFIQTLIIIILIWKFSPEVSITEQGTVGLVAVLYSVMVTTLLPEDLYYLLMTSIVPVMLYSRGLQILETFRCKHTGAQSIITNSMSLAGGLVRILTTIKEVGWDMAFLASIGVSVMVNFIIFLQYFYFRSNTENFLADLKAKKKL